MAKIVKVSVVDETKPIAQSGFKKVLIFDTSVALATTEVMDTATLTAGSNLEKAVSRFLGNGADSVIVSGEACADKAELVTALKKVADEHDFYGFTIVAPALDSAEVIEGAADFADAYEKLGLIEISIAKADVAGFTTDVVSDRVVVYAKTDVEYTGQAAAVAGACFPKVEGSINWGNTVVNCPLSGYKLDQESELIKRKINYVTKVGGLVVSQFAKTLANGNADVTRSKDFLAARLEEALTAMLVNSPKVPFTTIGMAMVKGAMDVVGVQAVNAGMLDEYHSIVPKVSEIPVNDKANRVLNGVKFVAKLAGAVDTIELTLEVTL